MSKSVSESVRNPYVPNLAEIIKIKSETPDTSTFRIKISNGSEFKFQPGQFIELTVFGYGEAPISISGGTTSKDSFEITVRKMGEVTSALFRLQEGKTVGIRGPFGHGWPLDVMKRKNVLLIGGGIGLAPLRPLIQEILKNRKDFERVILMYGARTPKDILFKDEFPLWSKKMEVYRTVDKGEPGWDETVGVVTVLFDEFEVYPEETIAVQCGPPIMMYFVTKKLKELGFPDENIYVSLERRMECGMGICGRCSIGGIYVCKDGPVFSYSTIKGLLERAI